MIDGISPKQFHESEGVEDWRVLGDGAPRSSEPGRSGQAPSSCGRSANCRALTTSTQTLTYGTTA
jgi:hypothetical protein